MVEIPYPLTTERLVLRRFAAGDLDAYYAYQQLPATARYLLNEARSYTECMGRIAMYVDAPFEQEGHWASFAIERAGAPGLVGEIALKWSAGGTSGDGVSPERVGEIGWTLAPQAQGLGIATEAARSVLELAMDGFGFHRVEARLDARNSASAAICERLGMRREGVLRDNMYLKGEWTSEAIYAVVRKPPAAGGA
ncbi:GNAT family N-acetyltransferase [Arthrobacter livingstonensis]|uniref:GNAT family N-acetyltransferase n=1 Tax=Arthrobacter livingstonensis TaxID=670078 RepID=A0A2V5LKS6_9MICC|nr:GNAT family protein [Arthrobacter livingstonensis]PYI67910.1 GNAT family N-acetyltransferase [Arthrobacter livingstonensis]